VWVNSWLKRWAEGRKGEDVMKVNQELDLDWRAENGRNLGRAIPQTHLPSSTISQHRSLDTRGLHITTRLPLRPFGPELKAEGLSTGYQTRQQDGG